MCRVSGVDGLHLSLEWVSPPHSPIRDRGADFDLTARATAAVPVCGGEEAQGRGREALAPR